MDEQTDTQRKATTVEGADNVDAHAVVGIFPPGDQGTTLVDRTTDVLRPGSYCVALAPVRYHDVAVALENMAYTIRNTILYLRPQPTPILLARRPLAENTVAENVIEYGTGGLNIGGSGVPVAEGRPNRTALHTGGADSNAYERDIQLTSGMATGTTDEDRHPANILLSKTAAQEMDQSVASGRTPPSEYFHVFEDGDGLFEHLVRLVTNHGQRVYVPDTVGREAIVDAVTEAGRVVVSNH